MYSHITGTMEDPHLISLFLDLHFRPLKHGVNSPALGTITDFPSAGSSAHSVNPIFAFKQEDRR